MVYEVSLMKQYSEQLRLKRAVTLMTVEKGHTLSRLK